MSNITYTGLNREILNNPVIACHLRDRLSSMTPDEKEKGYFIIEFTDGTGIVVTVGRTPPRLREEKEKLISKKKVPWYKKLFKREKYDLSDKVIIK